MFNKLYDSIKKNYRFFLFLIFITILFTIRFPYTIDAPGGYIDLTNRIDGDNFYTAQGSFNMAYVSEVDATIPTLFYAFINPNWDISKNKDILMENETVEDLLYRNKLALEEANNNAIITAYTKAGYDYEIKNKNLYIAYIDINSNTNLKVGDNVIKVDDKIINYKEEIGEIINSKNVGDTINFTVENNNKQYERYAKVFELDGNKIVGIVIYEIVDLETNPKIKIKTEKSESGPSGGLMTALAIYNSLIEEDITGGNKIVGTGTIDSKGNVGSIGGVKYKLIGAVKNKAKIFILPKGENYEEAIKLKEQKKYDIEIIGVSTFDEALEVLNEYNNR